jgi:hypothetical protein
MLQHHQLEAENSVSVCCSMDGAYPIQGNTSRCEVEKQGDDTIEAQFDSDAILSQEEDLRCPSHLSSVSPIACTAMVYDLSYVLLPGLRAHSYKLLLSSSLQPLRLYGARAPARQRYHWAIVNGCNVPGRKRKAATKDCEAAFQFS